MYDDAFGYSLLVPENIREIFMWLCQDVASLHSKWGLYLGLFTEEENTRLLSELTLATFNVIEESLRNDMTMLICRLSDPPAMGGHTNLSLQTLPEECGHIGNVSELMENFLAACEPVRQIRNRRVGHNDLSTTINPNENPLPGIGRTQIDEIVGLAGRILNVIYQNYIDSELNFQPMVPGGADALLHWLRLAKQAEAEGFGDPFA